MNGNYWQTGGVEVAFSFGLFGRFPDFLPLGQQYLPLNRKPRIWLPVVDNPRARGRVADAGLNARGLWERDWVRRPSVIVIPRDTLKGHRRGKKQGAYVFIFSSS